MPSLRKVRAELVGFTGEPLATVLLTDLLYELDILFESEAPRGRSARIGPDVVFVFAGRDDLEVVLARAGAHAQGVPLIAILPFDDDGLVERAMGAGAEDCYALDAPARELKCALVALLVRYLEARGTLH